MINYNDGRDNNIKKCFIKLSYKISLSIYLCLTLSLSIYINLIILIFKKSCKSISAAKITLRDK